MQHAALQTDLWLNCQSGLSFLTPAFPPLQYTEQAAFRSVLRSDENLARKIQKPRKVCFLIEESKEERRRAGNREHTYGGHHDRNSLVKHGLRKSFIQNRKKRASSCWADCTAFFLQLRRARQPGELLHHREACEKPVFTLKYQSLYPMC